MKAYCAAYLIAGLLITEPASGGQCSDLQPADGKLGYHVRSNPDRCEGLYQSLVSGEIELLSFLRRQLAFNPQTDATLTILAPKTAPGATSPVSIVARALPLHVYYQLDASLAPDQTFQWPISTIIVPAGFAAADLGVVGSVLTPDGRVFLPLDVKPQSHVPELYNRPVITFRASQDLDTFQWRLVADDAAPPWNKASEGRTIRMGDAVSFPVDGPTGRVVLLDLAAKPTTADWTRIRIRLFIP